MDTSSALLDLRATHIARLRGPSAPAAPRSGQWCHIVHRFRVTSSPMDRSLASQSRLEFPRFAGDFAILGGDLIRPAAEPGELGVGQEPNRHEARYPRRSQPDKTPAAVTARPARKGIAQSNGLAAVNFVAMQSVVSDEAAVAAW
jgi:hypothetical protein